MREHRVIAAFRLFVSPFGKVRLGQADGFFVLGEKDRRRWQEIKRRRVEVAEVGCQRRVANWVRE
jgi:hypothetical protein